MSCSDGSISLWLAVYLAWQGILGSEFVEEGSLQRALMLVEQVCDPLSDLQHALGCPSMPGAALLSFGVWLGLLVLCAH